MLTPRLPNRVRCARARDAGPQPRLLRGALREEDVHQRLVRVQRRGLGERLRLLPRRARAVHASLPGSRRAAGNRNKKVHTCNALKLDANAVRPACHSDRPLHSARNQVANRRRWLWASGGRS